MCAGVCTFHCVIGKSLLGKPHDVYDDDHIAVPDMNHKFVYVFTATGDYFIYYMSTRHSFRLLHWPQCLAEYKGFKFGENSY